MDLEKKEIQENTESNKLESFSTFVEGPETEIIDSPPEVVVEETGVGKSKPSKSKKASKVRKEGKEAKSVKNEETNFPVSVGYPLEVSDDDNEWRKALVEKRLAA